MRVTTQMAVNRMVGNLEQSYGRVTRFQEQLSSGTRINNISDDPAAAERSLALRGDLRNIEQFERNIDNAMGWLQQSETALGDLEGVMAEARGLAIQGANDTFSDQQRLVMAEEVDQLLEHALSLSQTRLGGRYIFAGTKTGERPFEARRDDQGRAVEMVSNGDLGGEIVRQVAEDTQVVVNVPGDQVFTGEHGAFERLIELRDALLAGDTDQARQALDGLEQAQNAVSGWRGQLGALGARLEDTRQLHQRATVDLGAALADTEDVDLATTIMYLQREQDVFQAALASGNSIIPQSLMDFIG